MLEYIFFYLEVQQNTPRLCFWPAGATPLRIHPLLQYQLSNTGLCAQHEVQKKSLASIKW